MTSYKYYSKATNFIITNVCNYNCSECNTFNNWAFHGNEQKWNDFKDIYANWSKILDVGNYEICGGEATTNPDWFEWINGVHRLWPDNLGCLRTNGQLLKKDPVKFKKLQDLFNNANGKLKLSISLHNADRIDDVIALVKEFLGTSWIPHNHDIFLNNFINSYNNIKAHDWPAVNSINDFTNLPDAIKIECSKIYNFTIDSQRDKQLNDYVDNFKKNISSKKSDSYFYFTNSNNVEVEIGTEQYFFDSILNRDHLSDQFFLRYYNTNIEKSHYECQARCTPVGAGFSTMIFIAGKMYKCAISKLLADFDRQFYINMSDTDRALVHGYIPASLDMSEDDMDSWFENMHTPISLCKFCPESYTNRNKISAGTKKIFIKKKPKSQQ